MLGSRDCPYFNAGDYRASMQETTVLQCRKIPCFDAGMRRPIEPDGRKRKSCWRSSPQEKASTAMLGVCSLYHGPPGAGAAGEDRHRGRIPCAGCAIETRCRPVNGSSGLPRNAPGADVILSHPQPVRTGLTLFDPRGAHNFPTLIFHETGYDLFTLRQRQAAAATGVRETLRPYGEDREGPKFYRVMRRLEKRRFVDS